MAATTLSQSEIDRLLNSLKGSAAAPIQGGKTIDEFDFRRPDKFPSDLVRQIEELHRGLASLVSSSMSRDLRTAVRVEVIAVEQMTYDSYVRSMPNPNLMFILDVDPLPGRVVLEISPQLGFILVDRLLGGPGRPIPVRRPTELETALLGQIMRHPIDAMRSSFETVQEINPVVVSTEVNPQFAHAAPPAEMMLMVTLAVSIQGPHPSSALMGLSYPFTTLEPVAALLRQHKWSQGASETLLESDDSSLSLKRLRESSLDLRVQLRPTKLTIGEMAELQPGDVIKLDHWADDLALGVIDGTRIMEGKLGRQGDHLALEIARWRVDK